ncbi:ChrR Cupin-like domain protein [Mycobacterium marinum]|nr:hypothetical protein MULP_03556 [Mycobacterium liflandii 128FXT]AXN45310.1 ChrR Cupin-like domain protein [Mycobacterium marinum]AXN50609.1 ChrR Cupin-like domain protein [Mycobacterium marinum]RFZ02471.1 ChrR Cupin-like domain protein [Mycobacterium marinum]RFZ18014.1 ChrR Cupin-like domain protein [Mycobacterium marinum]
MRSRHLPPSDEAPSTAIENPRITTGTTAMPGGRKHPTPRPGVRVPPRASDRRTSLTVKRLSLTVKTSGSAAGTVGVDSPAISRKDPTMTLATAPAPATTATGAPLPLVALPQGELLTVNEHDVPLVHDALGPGVHFKPLRLDIENGEWLVLATFEPGATVPLHYHTGTAEVYTLSGCWHYLEYPDQLQTAGSYLYEPGSSVHTFVTPTTNTEDTVFLVRVQGANINFTDDGQFDSILDAALIAHVTQLKAEEQNLGPINYIGGGAAGHTTKEA